MRVDYKWTGGHEFCSNCRASLSYSPSDLQAESWRFLGIFSKQSSFYLMCPECGEKVGVHDDDIPWANREKMIDRAKIEGRW